MAEKASPQENRASDRMEPARQERTPAEISREDLQAAQEAVTKGDRFRDIRNWSAARNAYAEALDRNPDLQPIWIQLGHAAKESGDYPAAEAAYHRALELNPDDADGYLQLGHLLKLRGLFAAAVQAYARSLALNPSLTEVHAEINLLQGKLDSARGSRHAETPILGSFYGHKETVAANTFTVVFDVSDLMHYFQHARLPTGIQRVQIEVIKAAIDNPAPNFAYSIVCFTKETDFWLEIPSSLFLAFCKSASVSGDLNAPEWQALQMELNVLLGTKNYYAFPRASVLLNLGTSWWLQNYFLNVRLAKSLYRIEYVPFVHDFIPAIAPEHCVDELRHDFLSWAIGAFDHADHFLVNSKATLKDLHAVGAMLGYDVSSAAVVTLDADFRRPTEPGSNIADAYFLQSVDLEKDKYVLFVATIESRKNHLAAFSVWLRLLKKHGAKNVPKLVCVGNDGWLNDAAYAKLRASEQLSRHVLMLSKISDFALSVLYENCLCTLYPSSYEGWGLPVTEALCHGKVPVVSNTSSLPEAGGEFAEYFDTESEKDFLGAVERIVFNREYRKQRERKITSAFGPRTWRDISSQIVHQLQDWHKQSMPARESEACSIPGIWPVEAELNTLHVLGGPPQSSLWAGLRNGEVFRNGPGWWWPEPWGCWIKELGPSHLAFKLADVKDAAVLVYLGVNGVQEKDAVCKVRVDGGQTVEVSLKPMEYRVLKLRLPRTTSQSGLVVLTITSSVATDFSKNTKGQDTRVAGVGVRWFYACREADVLGRLDLLEALSSDDLDSLKRQPPLDSGMLLAAQ